MEALGAFPEGPAPAVAPWVCDVGFVGQIGGASLGCAVEVGQLGGGGFVIGTSAPAGGACGGLVDDQTLKVKFGAAYDPCGAMA